MYRIVAADSQSPRGGRFIETLGHYNPLTEPATIVIKQDRLDHWLQHGAQATDVVKRLVDRWRAAPPEPASATTSRRTSRPAATAQAPAGPEASATAASGTVSAEARGEPPEAAPEPAAPDAVPASDEASPENA